MKTNKMKLVSIVCASVMLTSCATMEKSMGLGAIGCAGVGALTGVLTNSAGIGAGAGAGCMALAAVAIYSYHTSQVRTEQLYGYATPTSGTQLKIREAMASPKTTKAGDKIKVVLDYSVIAPQGTQDVSVEEKTVLKKDGKVLMDVDKRTVKRPLGGSSSEINLGVPKDAAPGTYVIESTIKTGSSYDTRDAVFVVGS